MTACGVGSTSSSSGGDTSSTESGASGVGVKPGAAGVASAPRDVAGVFSLDDGDAMFKTRPKSENRTGVTDDEILIGVPSPLTGPSSAVEYGTLYQPMVDAVNAAGGIHGRKLKFIVVDNGGNGATAVPAVQKLVLQDKVFAVFGSQITGAALAVAPFLAEQKVPDICPISAAIALGKPVVKSRFMCGLDSGPVDGIAIAKWITDNVPKAKVAVIYQNDDFGKAALPNLKEDVEKAGGSIVAEVGYNIATATDLTSQVQQALAAKPTVLVANSLVAQQSAIVKIARETSGSKIPILTGVGASIGSVPAPYMDGALGVMQVKPITSSDDPTIVALTKLFTEAGQKVTSFIPSANMPFQHLVHALELAGPDLTREGVIEAAENGFTGDWSCTVCFGPSKMTPTNHWAIRSVEMFTYDHAQGKPVSAGDVIVANPFGD